MEVKRIAQGGLVVLFAMWANGFKLEWRELGGALILLALLTISESIAKDSPDA